MTMYMGTFFARDRRVLLNKWIGEAWEKTCTNKDMVIKAFKKCGVSMAIYGSEDEEMNINNIEDYEVESSEEDPFESCNQEESDHIPATESETSTSDEIEIESDSEVSISEDIHIIDLFLMNLAMTAQ